ncbi:hypothetical protein Aab01nite_74560 [Paractinoplanes abujensis]|uniref:Uncharacterized protein n=1 Tax=Paractinoplanes abujensis TaxID=882441 RepID=A0A7W7CVE7_9ACTN|nr:hypothetical protein [Actinoplanes abujensis]MBB4695134.1 hypothetical protein [Actinoplanes abujensis]GID23866.1 hypothetical protein Aab01nite_74560 [Actinoplanes abujensis]
MTSQPQPAPGEGKPAGQFLRPLRDLAAYALVGAPALLLFVAVIRLIPDGENQFGYRTQDSFYGFVNTATVFMPLAAVLLAVLVQPRHPKASLITLIAVVEYAVMALFGVLFGLLIGLINHASNNGARIAFEELLVRAAWLSLLGVAGYATFRLWQGLFQVAKPKQQPGVYGQPAYGQPGTYPGQPGYGPPPQPQQPGFAPGSYPPPGAPPQPGYPQGYPQPQQPSQYGQPQGQPPAWNQPATPMPASAPPAPPASGPPGPFAPHPAPTTAFPQSQFTEPTRTAPAATPPGDDRTEKIPEDRPGFGPADEDPPRR